MTRHARRIRRLGALVGALVLFPVTANAQTASVTMSADRSELRVGEELRLEIRASTNGMSADGLQVPDLSSFHIVRHDTVPTMQFSFGFGSRRQVMQSTIVHRYVLQPTEAGTLALEPATIPLPSGGSAKSEPLTIVVREGLGGADLVPDPAQAPTGDLDGAVFDPQAFLRTVVDKTEPRLGEQVTVTLYLYMRGSLRQQPQVTQAPSVDGFWEHDLFFGRNSQPQRQFIQGSAFDVYMLDRFAAFPLREGELTVGAPTVEIQTGSLFDIIRQRGGGQLRREGVPVTVDVQPLPPPPGGASPSEVSIGRWELETSVDSTEVQTGDAVTVRATIEGIGNPKDLRLELREQEGLRVLPPEVDEEVTSPRDLVQGSRTFSWLVIPEEPGEHDLGTLRLVTFDPAEDRYRILESEPLRFEAVGPSLATGTDTEVTDDASEQVAGPSELDLGPLRRSSELRRSAPPLSDNPVFLALLLAPGFFFLGLLGARAWMRRRGARVSAAAPGRRLRDLRRQVDALAKAGDQAGWLVEAQRLLGTTLETRLGEAIGGFTYPALREHLEGRGMDSPLAEETASLLEEFELERFSPASDDANLGRRMARLDALLGQLHRFSPREAS